MKSRILAVLLLLAIASMATAAPACASRAAAAVSPECVVIDHAQRGSIIAASRAVSAHDFVAILSPSGVLPSRAVASHGEKRAATGPTLERQILLVVLRI